MKKTVALIFLAGLAALPAHANVGRVMELLDKRIGQYLLRETREGSDLLSRLIPEGYTWPTTRVQIERALAKPEMKKFAEDLAIRLERIEARFEHRMSFAGNQGKSRKILNELASQEIRFPRVGPKSAYVDHADAFQNSGKTFERLALEADKGYAAFDKEKRRFSPAHVREPQEYIPLFRKYAEAVEKVKLADQAAAWEVRLEGIDSGGSWLVWRGHADHAALWLQTEERHLLDWFEVVDALHLRAGDLSMRALRESRQAADQAWRWISARKSPKVPERVLNPPGTIFWNE